MKKILLISLLALLSLSHIQTAAALGPQNSGTSNAATKLKQRQEQFTEKKSEIQTQIQQRKEAIQNQLQIGEQNRLQKRTEIAQKHQERIQAHFQNYYDRLNRLMVKIQNRINTEAANGKDVSLSQAKLDKAGTKLNEALTSGYDAVAAFTTISNGQQEREQISAAKDLVGQARSQYREAVKLMHEAVAQLKLDAGIIN